METNKAIKMVDRITSKDIDELNKKAKEIFRSIGKGVYPYINSRYGYYAIDIHTKEGFGVERTYRSGYTAGEAFRVVEGMIRGAQAKDESFMWGGSKCGKGWHGQSLRHRWAAMGHKMGGYKISKESRFKKYYREYLYSPITGEEYSADAGDYWDMKRDMVLKDGRGHNLELVGDKGLDRFGKATLKTIMRKVTVGDLIDRIGRKR